MTSARSPSPGVPVIVRRAGRRDLEAIQALWEDLREHQHKQDARLATASGAGRLAAEHREVLLANRSTAFFVAEDGNELVGFLHARVEQNDPAYMPERYGEIIDLLVVAQRRSSGIGSRLLEYAVEWFVAQNASQYRVSMPVHATEVARFFERHGALPLQVRHAASIED